MPWREQHVKSPDDALSMQIVHRALEDHVSVWHAALLPAIILRVMSMGMMMLR
jgi:hypothetical protein